MEQWMNDYASWVLVISGAAAMFTIGRKKRWGWLWFIFNEFMWTAYALITKQYGFILGAILYGIVGVRSYMRWKDIPLDKHSWNKFLRLVWSRND
jgi:hypothetical protein